MKDTFDLLKEYIIENAYEYEVYDLKVYEENEEEASIYHIRRKPRKTEKICEAIMKRGTTEFTLYCEEEYPEWSEIYIANKNEPYVYQSLTIVKRDGKITIK